MLVWLQYISFPAIITELADSIETERLKAGRDKLMWVLLQFISGVCVCVRVCVWALKSSNVMYAEIRVYWSDPVPNTNIFRFRFM